MRHTMVNKIILGILIIGLSLAGKTPKNLKVLKFDNNKDITKYMKSISKDLGQKCIYCHDMKDKSKDTSMKETARKFMTLVDHINSNILKEAKDSKKETKQISCWTYHRGNIEPQLIRPK